MAKDKHPEDKAENKRSVLAEKPDKPEETNPVEESKATGTAATDDGRVVETTSPAVPDSAPDVDEENGPNPNAELSAEAVAELCGELTNAEAGYLPLDKDGYIIGPAKRGEPGPDEFFARVICNDTGGFHQRALTTPAGAPITRKMNPDQKRTDEDHNVHAREALEQEQSNAGDGQDSNDGS